MPDHDSAQESKRPNSQALRHRAIWAQIIALACLDVICDQSFYGHLRSSVGTKQALDTSFSPTDALFANTCSCCVVVLAHTSDIPASMLVL